MWVRSEFCLRMLLPYPVYEFLRDGHSGEPALTNQRPVGELGLLLDLGERHRRVDAAGVLQIDDRRILGFFGSSRGSERTVARPTIAETPPL